MEMNERGAVSETDMVMAGHDQALREESPYGWIQHKKLGIWLFILSDAVTFASILWAYGYVRLGSAGWPRPFEFSPTIINGIVMTFVLLSSSLTMLGAYEAAKRGNKSRAITWLGVTMLLGVLFAGLHISEWFRMIGAGWRLFQNPMGGPALFGATFFSITGLHLTHVIAGVIAIRVVSTKFNRGHMDAGHVETVGLYWHFVDVVWMFVFPLVYLMNAR
jgi:cytochrome c oxidase subunit 3